MYIEIDFPPSNLLLESWMMDLEVIRLLLLFRIFSDSLIEKLEIFHILYIIKLNENTLYRETKRQYSIIEQPLPELSQNKSKNSNKLNKSFQFSNILACNLRIRFPCGQHHKQCHFHHFYQLLIFIYKIN